MYVCMHIHIHIHKHTHIHTYPYTYRCMYMPGIHIYAFMHVYMHNIHTHMHIQRQHFVLLSHNTLQYLCCLMHTVVCYQARAPLVLQVLPATALHPLIAPIGNTVTHCYAWFTFWRFLVVQCLLVCSLCFRALFRASFLPKRKSWRTKAAKLEAVRATTGCNVPEICSSKTTRLSSGRFPGFRISAFDFSSPKPRILCSENQCVRLFYGFHPEDAK